MSLSSTYAFDPGASKIPTTFNHAEHLQTLSACSRYRAGLTRRQIQITTTITPTITRGASQTAIPTRTDLRERPVASQTPSESSKEDDSIFPANLSWWQVLGIALAGVVLLGVVVYIFMSRRKKAKVADLKAKEAEMEEGGRRKNDLGGGYGLGGMGVVGMGMGGVGMGMGMGGMPMMWSQGQGNGTGGGRKKRRKKRYDSEDESDSDESYDSLSESDGGTIRPRRRRRPRGKKEGRRGRGGKYDYSSDESVASTFYARPRKDISRNDKYDRRRDGSSWRTPTSKDSDMPLGLGPPTTGLHTGSSGKSLGRKGSLGQRFRDSVFSTYDSMKNKAARLEILRNEAIEAKRLEQELKLQAALMEEEKIEMERQRQIKIRDANKRLRRETAEEEERARQNMIPLYPTPQPRRIDSQSPMIPPVPKSHSNDSNRPSPDQHRKRSPGKQQKLRERLLLSPASAYNSALPAGQSKTKRSSSDLPYAYDGVATFSSSQPPVAHHKSDRQAERGDRNGSTRRAKPPLHRQDSDQPLKSAMRTPGDRSRPRRKATITEKPPTTRMITDPRVYDRGSQSDWLPKPPAVSKTRQARQPSDSSDRLARSGSVTLSVPDPRHRPTIRKGELAPAPPPRAKVRPQIHEAHTPMSGSGAAGVGAGAARGDQANVGRWLGWKASGGIGNVEVSSDHTRHPVLDGVARPPASRTITPPTTDPGKRWANRLRERK